METSSPLLREVERLRAEYRELEAVSCERDADDGVALHDAQLTKLQLSQLVQRYREKPPPIEDVAERYEAELKSLAEEALRLREENTKLVLHGSIDYCGTERASATAQQPAVRTAAEELSDEVRSLRRQQVESKCRDRRTRLEEWRLGSLKDEAKRALRQLKARDQQLLELRDRHSKADAYLQDSSKAVSQGEAELDRERQTIRELHCQVAALREACTQPARLKKESGFLVRLLDQEGGRLQTRRHLRGMEACRKLYDEVASHAPSLLPLAGRARSEMEAGFAKYLRLEEAHGRSLQKLHLAVTRGLLRDPDGCSTCGAAGSGAINASGAAGGVGIGVQ